MDVLESYTRDIDNVLAEPELDVLEFEEKAAVISHAKALLDDDAVEEGEAYCFFLEGGDDDPYYIGFKDEEGEYREIVWYDDYSHNKDLWEEECKKWTPVFFGPPITVDSEVVCDRSLNSSIEIYWKEE